MGKGQVEVANIKWQPAILGVFAQVLTVEGKDVGCKWEIPNKGKGWTPTGKHLWFKTNCKGGGLRGWEKLRRRGKDGDYNR